MNTILRHYKALIRDIDGVSLVSRISRPPSRALSTATSLAISVTPSQVPLPSSSVSFESGRTSRASLAPIPPSRGNTFSRINFQRNPTKPIIAQTPKNLPPKNLSPKIVTPRNSRTQQNQLNSQKLTNFDVGKLLHDENLIKAKMCKKPPNSTSRDKTIHYDSICLDTQIQELSNELIASILGCFDVEVQSEKITKRAIQAAIIELHNTDSVETGFGRVRKTSGLIRSILTSSCDFSR